MKKQNEFNRQNKIEQTKFIMKNKMGITKLNKGKQATFIIHSWRTALWKKKIQNRIFHGNPKWNIATNMMHNRLNLP